MNKKSKWLLALGLATIMTSSGIVMAATASEQGAAKEGMFGAHRMGKHMKHEGHGKMDHTALLELLKIDEATFKTELKAGKTIAQIATEHGVSEEAVTALVKEQMTKRVEEAIESGRIPAERAAEMKSKIAQHAEQMIKSGPKMMQKIDTTELQKLLGIDDKTLREEFKSGKSMATIATEHGVSKEQVTEVCKQIAVRHIDEAVKAGRIPADKAEQLKAKISQNADKLIARNPMKHNRLNF